MIGSNNDNQACPASTISYLFSAFFELMCGICGQINTGNKYLLKGMNDAMAHRGPDDEGIMWFDKWNSGLGHKRLSIIDLSSAGHQPLTDDEQRYWIVYNGELYNYRDIKQTLEKLGHTFRSHCDTEVILKAYKQWGKDALQQFNGMFAFAIFDNETGNLFGARDRIGIKPLYYYRDKDYLVFASEIKAILKSEVYDKEIDYDSLYNPARFTISPFTGFKNIRKLPPGHWFEFKNGDMQVSSYWEIKPVENPIGESEAEEQLDYLLNDAVKLEMISDVPVGVLLSGGLDSSIISALAHRNTDKEIHSFTISFSKQDQKLQNITDDSFYAKKMAQEFNFIHHDIEVKPDIEDLLHKMVWHIDEPLADPAAINTYLISKHARDLGIIVLLNGMGGDEIFGGYRKQLACLLAAKYVRFTPAVLQHFLNRMIGYIPVSSNQKGYKSIRWLKRFLGFASYNDYERFLASDLSLSRSKYNRLYNREYYESYFYVSQKKYFDNNDLHYLTRMCLNDTKVFLPEHNLTYSDKATMAASIESRPPLTDHRIVEFMFKLPARYRISGKMQKALLKKVSEKYIPGEVIYRPKAPFSSPLRSWLKGPLREMIDDYLVSNNARTRDLYNRDFVREIIHNDRSGLEDNSLFIWHMLTTEIWMRTFFN